MNFRALSMTPYGATKRPRLGNRRGTVGAGRCSPNSLRKCPTRCNFLVLTVAGGVNRHQEDLIDYLRDDSRH